MPNINAPDFPDFSERRMIVQKAGQVIAQARELVIRLDLAQELSPNLPNPHLVIQVRGGKTAQLDQPRA